MSDLGPIAFYAPLKSPLHPSPSGDRTMARLLMKALHHAGFDPRLASELRTLDKAGRPEIQESMREQSHAETDRLLARYTSLPRAERPRLWFTYHVYYKAPDWIGPRTAEALGIPYVVAEASRAAKRAAGPWSLGHAGAEAAIDRADVVFVMTDADREALERGRPLRQALVDCPPFLDTEAWPKLRPVRQDGDRPPRLLTVAMMRTGDKLASYRILAEALAGIADQPWVLDIVGDGEARRDIESLFCSLGARVAFHGLIDDRDALARFYAGADLFLWPAVNEAYGMALLEAQVYGCPVVAGAYGGVRNVVHDRETAILTRPGDAQAFSEAVVALLRSPERRQRLGDAAGRYVRETRDLETTAKRIRTALLPLLAERVRP